MAYKYNPAKVKAENNLPHVIIVAGPGSGKTTTMVAGLNIILGGSKPEWFDSATDEQKAIWEEMAKGTYQRIAFQAFNKSIANELQAKVPDGVKACTFHAAGGQILRENGYKLRPNADNDRYLISDLLGYKPRERMNRDHFLLSLEVSKVISLLKSNLLDATKANVEHLFAEGKIASLENVNQVVDLASKAMEKMKSVEPGQSGFMSFDDMLWLPVVLDLKAEAYDLLICDESQDLNPLQHEVVTRSAKRLICVGDPRQAIYGFRGADSKSMETLETVLSETDRGVITLPLLTSFRLPKSGVENVNGYAPNLVARPDAPEGIIEPKSVNEIEPENGSLVLSRVNKNLFSMAFRLLKKKIAVRIQGRDFGKSLMSIIKKNTQAGDSIEQARIAIDVYKEQEENRILRTTFPEKALQMLDEKCACLYTLTENCQSVQDMLDVLENLFSEDLSREQVVLLSTIHRAKGLEAETVYFLEPQLIPHPMAKEDHEKEQEYNLKFVAETRHTHRLVYVSGGSNDVENRDEIEGRMADQVAE